jgi:kynurenine formamidase
MTGHIAQINLSPGGVPKRPVPTARVTRAGIEGDAHRHAEQHGGPDRALCLFSLEQIERSIAPAEWATHHTFFPAGIGIIEYLVNLDQLGRDRVRFAALPLKLDGGDGAPARALAILD